MPKLKLVLSTRGYWRWELWDIDGVRLAKSEPIYTVRDQCENNFRELFRALAGGEAHASWDDSDIICAAIIQKPLGMEV